MESEVQTADFEDLESYISRNINVIARCSILAITVNSFLLCVMFFFMHEYFNLNYLFFKFGSALILTAIFVNNKNTDNFFKVFLLCASIGGSLPILIFLFFFFIGDLRILILLGFYVLQFVGVGSILYKKFLRGTKIIRSFGIFVGYTLSPLSMYNDLIVNVPLAIGFANIVKLVMPERFFMAYILVGYILTNIFGLWLMVRFYKDLVIVKKREIVIGFIVNFTIVVITILLLSFGIIQLPTEVAGMLNLK